MGIKGLPKLIEDKAKCAIREIKFAKFKGKKVAVDASLIIHQTVIALRSSGRDLKNSKGELTSHLRGLFYKIINFLKNEMIPIFVFDGKAPDIKNKTIVSRRARREIAEKLVKKRTSEEAEADKNLSDDEDYIKNFKQSFKPTKENIREAQILLDLIGIPYIVAPGEADVVCAWLASRKNKVTKRSYVKGVCSDDSDMLPLGAPLLFKDMLKFMSLNKEIKVINLDSTLSKLNLTHDEFIDLCVMLGTDYCDNIPGIGPQKAFQLITEHRNLENIFKHLEKEKKNSSKHLLDSSSDSEGEKVAPDMDKIYQCMYKARDYFRNAVNDLDNSDDFVLTPNQLNLRQFQYEELMDFMCIKHGFDIERIQHGINLIKECYDKMNVVRPNNKKVHQIIQPRSENYIFKVYDDELELLSESETESDNDEIEEEEEEGEGGDEDTVHNKSIRTKKKSDLIKRQPKVKSENKRSDLNVKTVGRR